MSVFDKVGGLKPQKSVFNLSHNVKLTCDMGQLIPFLCEECVPGDYWKFSNEMVVRFQPMVAPILHEVNIRTFYFFVPTRLLWKDWSDFITGGVDGDFEASLPLWRPKAGTGTAVGTLWDYFSFPVGVVPDDDHLPLIFPLSAYIRIFIDYFRDENIDTMYDDKFFEENFYNKSGIIESTDDVMPLNIRWRKDYFTSALPWQQRGTSPALPLTGTASVLFDNLDWPNNFVTAYWPAAANIPGFEDALTTGLTTYQRRTEFAGAPSVRSRGLDVVYVNEDTNYSDDARVGPGGMVGIHPSQFTDYLSEHNHIDVSGLVSVDINDLRLAFQIQKWMERNARAGARYTEFLRAHFGVSPRDDRLQRPEYLGGSVSPVIISEVLQTSATDAGSPQGTMAGHGLGVSKTFVGKYHVQEFGYIMGIMAVVPKPGYMQGINRQWLRRSRYDFYFREFANLSEQAIETAEIYCTDDAEQNKTIFGFNGRYQEMRFKENRVCGEFRTELDYWHLARKFDNAPKLNSDFIQIKPEYTKRIFAVQNRAGCLVEVGNLLKVARPLPYVAEPGLIDHH